MTTSRTTDPERALFAAVLRLAVDDALSDGPEQADACAFLRDTARCGPICAALGLEVTWFQHQLQRQYPAIWEDAPVLPASPAADTADEAFTWGTQWLIQF